MPKTHGMSRNPKFRKEFKAWSSMKWRCYNKNALRWKRYGGRGIKVCKRWLCSFENFYSDVGPAPSIRHTLHRINNNGSYSPKNVCWVLPKVQSRNKSNNRLYRLGEKHQTLIAWCEEFGIEHRYRTIVGRVYQYGWHLKRALTTP